MRKSVQVLFAVFVSVTCVTGRVSAQEGAIAIIDMNRVFEEYDRTKSAKEKMEQQGAVFKQEVSEKVEAMQKLEEDFNLARQEAYDLALSEDVRNQRKTDAEQTMIELQNQEREVKKFRDSRKKELADTSGRLIQAILDEIKVKVDKFAKSRGYFMVLDSSGSTFNRLPAVVYHDGSADITDEVLGLLNSGADVEAQEAAEE